MRARFIRWIVRGGVLLLVLIGLISVRLLRHPPPAGLMEDIRAGIGARDIKDPDERVLHYLEAKYGSFSDAANRDRAFLDFFNVEHIRALQLLVRHSPESHRQANVDAMARWIAEYRACLTPDERASLAARLATPEGQIMLKRATAQYNSQDVRYRGATAPVISQLLKTINQLGQGR